MKYYALYDFQLNEYTLFVDTDKKRLINECACWYYDMSYDDMINDIEEQYLSSDTEITLDEYVNEKVKEVLEEDNEKFLYWYGFEIQEISEKWFNYIENEHDYNESRISAYELKIATGQV